MRRAYNLICVAHKRFQDYPKPSVAVDVVCLTVEAGRLSVLLYERSTAPQKGTYALPGGFYLLYTSRCV